MRWSNRVTSPFYCLKQPFDRTYQPTTGLHLILSWWYVHQRTEQQKRFWEGNWWVYVLKHQRAWWVFGGSAYKKREMTVLLSIRWTRPPCGSASLRRWDSDCSGSWLMSNEKRCDLQWTFAPCDSQSQEICICVFSWQSFNSGCLSLLLTLTSAMVSQLLSSTLCLPRPLSGSSDNTSVCLVKEVYSVFMWQSDRRWYYVLFPVNTSAGS